MSLDKMQILLTEHQYFLKRQSVYIGVAEPDTSVCHVFPQKAKKFVAKEVTLIPSFVKVCDEAIVNASDAMQNFSRIGLSPSNGRIEFTFDKENDMVTVFNRSPHSIEIKKEVVNEYGDERWLPQAVFTKIHVSSNFVEADQEKTNHKGGVNGIGSKAITYTSSWFQLELVKDGKFYQQTFTNRCEFAVPNSDGECDVTEPIIKKAPKGTSDYVKVSFIPDPAAFKLKPGTKLLTDDTIAFLRKRCCDIILMNPGVTILVDGVNISSLSKRGGIDGYFDLFGFDTKNCLHFSKEFERKTGKNRSDMTNKIDYYVFDSGPDGVGFQLLLNGLAVKASSLYGNLMGDLTPYILSKAGKDGSSTTNKNTVNRYLSVVCIAQLNNIDFASQTKDSFAYGKVKFDFDFDGVLSTIKKMKIWEICSKIAAEDDLAKYEKKYRNLSTTGIKNYKKCEMSGKKLKKGEKLTLILIEGKSAMATIKDGLSKDQGKYHSIYALKGKPINVKSNALEMVFENKEFIDVMAILGLKIVKDPTSPENKEKNAITNLRYSNVCIMSDQDSDGAHIRGLLINMFNFFWPHLVEEGFLTVIRTPIVKIYTKSNIAAKGPDGKSSKKEKTATAKVCYTLKDYNDFLQNPGNININTMIVKYIKGLGSLNTVDAAEVFKNYNTYTLFKDSDADDSLNLVFDKDKADERKTWISYAAEDEELDANTDEIFVSDLIDTEVKNYSRYNTSRSLPSVIDGLKKSQRKVLDTCFQDNRYTAPGVETKKIIKVSQLGGLVSTRTGYIHGEDSLFKAIIGLAQNFAGSNNLNPLLPFGQVGTRIGGSKEAAAPRYVFTAANAIMAKIFRKEDHPIQKRLLDDGDEIEPENLIPIIPFLLINGSTGIGSGYSCNVPLHHPIDVVDKMSERISGEIPEDLTPWYRYSNCSHRYVDFNPEGMTSVDEKYKTPTVFQFGEYTINGNTVTVTDIPTGFLYNKLEEYYEKICEKQMVAKAKKVAKAKEAKGDGESKDDAYVPPEEIILSSFTMNYDTVCCNIVLELKSDYAAIINGTDESHRIALLRKLKLVDTKNMSFSNAHALTENNEIVLLRGTSHVIELFYKYRLNQYKLRKAHWLGIMEKEMKLKCNIEKFIRSVRTEKIKVGKDLDMPMVLAYLRKENFTRYNRKGVELAPGQVEEPEEEEVEDDFGVKTKVKVQYDSDPGYNYLLSIPFRSLTTSRADKLEKEIQELEEKIKAYQNYKIKDIWLDELDELREALLSYNEPIKRTSSAADKKGDGTIEEKYPFWFKQE